MRNAPSPYRSFARHGWVAMTDAEWAMLAPLLARDPAAAGRRPEDPRRLWDAIFWVACSSDPWRALPASLGRADTAHRALRRQAASGLLDRLLHAVARDDRLASLGWRIARAWRRAAGVLGLRQLLMAKRLGLLDALPCHPHRLPEPDLSETLLGVARDWFENRWSRRLEGMARLLHRMVAGGLRGWRLTD